MGFDKSQWGRSRLHHWLFLSVDRAVNLKTTLYKNKTLLRIYLEVKRTSKVVYLAQASLFASADAAYMTESSKRYQQRFFIGTTSDLGSFMVAS